MPTFGPHRKIYRPSALAFAQACREDGVEELATAGSATFEGSTVGQKFTKYARMYYFEKKNSKIFSSEGPRENVWKPRKNVSPGPAVALDGPAFAPRSLHSFKFLAPPMTLGLDRRSSQWPCILNPNQSRTLECYYTT